MTLFRRFSCSFLVAESYTLVAQSHTAVQGSYRSRTLIATLILRPTDASTAVGSFGWYLSVFTASARCCPTTIRDAVVTLLTTTRLQ